MNKRRWLPILCLAAALVACGPTEDNTQRATAPASTPEAPVITSVTEMSPSGTPIRTHVNSEASKATKSYTPTPRQSGTDPFLGTVSKEELILASDTIVRASLLSATSTAATSTEPDWPGWKAVLEFRFQVHEYLKGTGPDKITAIVTESFTYNSEAEAQYLAPELLAAHDSRWDSRQAILLLSAETDDINGFSSGRLWLGYLDLPIWADSDPDDRYSLRSYRRKLWLPAASEPSSAARGQRASNDNILFLLDVPQAGASTRSTRSSAGTAPTISLADMRSLVTTLEAEASAEGTAQHRRCVELYYEVERWGRFMTKQGWLPDVYESSIESGQPAGTLIATQPEFHSDRLAELPDPITEESLLLPWIAVFEGRDPAIVDYRVHDFETYFNQGDEQDADYWEIYFSMSFETTRPLPAGEYQFFFIRDAPNPPACTKTSAYSREGNDYRLTVTAPESSLREAFFDPVDIGDAVGADSANGVLEPNAFSLDGATTTISSLKWQDGAVTMTLNPTASLAHYAIDFIDVTGATTLSLTSDNASTTALTWTVPDKPWSDGDLLMLRIHRPISADATLSGLALSGIDLAFSSDTTTYAASVPATTTQTTVTPTTNHASATYVVKLAGVTDADGTIPLAAGENVITKDVTAEDAVTTKTYSITVTRAAPQAPVTVTLAPRPQGSATRVNITIEWNDPQTCDGEYLVALYTSSDYMVQFLGYTPASETPSRTTESATDWVLSRFPDWFAGVTCYPNASSDPARDLGRVSLRAAHPDSN